MAEPTVPEPKRKSRFPLVAAGGAAALAAGLGLAFMMTERDQGPSSAPPASEGGLVIDSSGAELGKLEAGKPLRCFVQGQFVGELTLTECARRNGVATDALDVGLDPNGALAAADQAGQALTPLPPDDAVAPSQPAQALPEVVEGGRAAAPAAAAPAPVGACWGRAGGRWRKLPGDMELNGCVQALFAGRCERPGGAEYGRWGQQTLRLVTGRVEISDDNKSFRPLGAQAPDCSIPPLG
jgi:hypothetical protein